MSDETTEPPETAVSAGTACSTPGPWEAIHTVGAGWSVRRIHPRPGYTGLAPICSMAWFQFPITGIIDDSISEANARLIAAAPELLEACRAMRRTMYSAESEESRMADAAIQKACGEA